MADLAEEREMGDMVEGEMEDLAEEREMGDMVEEMAEERVMGEKVAVEEREMVGTVGEKGMEHREVAEEREMEGMAGKEREERAAVSAASRTLPPRLQRHGSGHGCVESWKGPAPL